MEDLKQFILEKSQYFNMKVICEKAGVNYSTFRGWKNNGNALSEEKLRLLKNTMINVCKGEENMDATSQEIRQFLIDNGIKEYSRKIQEYPYKDGTFTVIDFLDKDNNGVAIIAENLTQDIETELYERFNKLYDNTYKMELIDD